MTIFINWILSALAIGIAAWLLPGAEVTLPAALIAAIVLGFINAFLRPILLLLTLPINVLTLGLFTFIINGLLVLLASVVVPGFAVAGFWSAVFFSIVLAIINVGISLMGAKGR